MTTNLLRGKSGAAANGKPDGPAIGESGARVFTCPSCERPLTQGTSRCPGCGVRLIRGVRLKRVGTVLTLGVALGVLGGGGAMAAIISLSTHEAEVGVTTQPPAKADADTAPVVPAVVLPAGTPSAAVSALSGTAVVNGRIAVDAATLATALADEGAPTISIARALRSLAADAALGGDLAARLAPWTVAAPVRDRLDGFYKRMATTAHDALRASLNDGGSYRAAGAEMLSVLGSLRDVDAASRRLAASVGLELPPVAMPRS
jgi:hypothetical protein